MKKYTASLVLSSITLFSWINQAHAESSSLGIYPPLTRINALPNATVRTPLTIVNNSDSEVLTNILLLGFKASNENNGTIEYYSLNTTPSDLKSLITNVKIFDEENQIKSLKLYPKESKNVIVEFSAPKESKDYSFSIILMTENDATALKEEDTVVKVSNGLATNMLLSVNPSQEHTAQISQLSTSPIKIGGPSLFDIEVQNTSGNYVSTTGTLYIYNIFGEKVGDVKLSPAIILSNSSRQLTNMNAVGTKRAEWNEDFTFGFYKAKAVVQVDKVNIITKETTFFSIPLSILLIVTVVLFIVLSISYRVVKKINFKQE